TEMVIRNFSYSSFILIGFSGPKEWRQLLFIPFLLMFLISVASNSMLMFIIVSHKALHSPMCLLICVLSFVDISVVIFAVPNMLFSLLLNWNHISLLGCLVQMFFVHIAGAFQSTILLWMALDRYFAICTPLHYNEHMTFSVFLKFVIIPSLRNIILILAIVGLAGTLQYCQSNEIDHCFCEHMALVTLACGPIYVNNAVGLITIFCIPATDFLLIIASYIKIFVSVFKSGKSSPKALSTCITHIMVMTVSIIFLLTAFLSYRIKNNLSSNSHAIISIIYLLVPACFNPIIYGIRTKEIRQQVMKKMRCGKVAQLH
uniref:Olfactory receptor 52E8-like n=1 Tax=Scleropages formosus TaxID=113540 RepID=A0A8C9UYA4_SCLFO